MDKPELISFDLCPFVHRSELLLRIKNVQYDVRNIDLSNKPAWFLEISPFGKVPVLKIGEVILFESAIINEYLDEVFPPPIHPQDPLQRAHNRAWIEFGSHLLFDMFHWIMAPSEDESNETVEQFLIDLEHLENQLKQGPFFNADAFGLIDAAYAPLFIRIHALEQCHAFGILDTLPKTSAWSQELLNHPEVQKSASDEFYQKYFRYIKDKNVFLSQFISAETECQ